MLPTVLWATGFGSRLPPPVLQATGFWPRMPPVIFAVDFGPHSPPVLWATGFWPRTPPSVLWATVFGSRLPPPVLRATGFRRLPPPVSEFHSLCPPSRPDICPRLLSRQTLRIRQKEEGRRVPLWPRSARFTGEPVSSGQLSASQPRFPGFELASVRAAVWSALL